MNSSEIQRPSSLFSMPEYGKRHKHLEPYEIKWICEKNCTGYSNKSKVLKKIYSIDLKELENSINTKFCRNNTPKWYVIMLLHYNRIVLSFEAIIRLVIQAKEVLYEGAPFVNLEFLNNFIKLSKVMKYSQYHVNSTVTIIYKMMLIYQCNMDSIFHYLNDFCDKVITIQKDSYYNASALYNVLKNMGYKIDSFKSESIDVIRSDLLLTKNNEIRSSFEEYGIYLQAHRQIKTTRCLLSHIRVFLNYISEKHPEVNQISQLSNKHIVDFIEYEKNDINIFGRKNTSATINHRIQAINGMLKYFQVNGTYNVQDNVISEYDCLKEHKVYPSYVPKDDIFKVLQAIKSIDERKYLEEKMVLIILIDTGRRISEVLSLRYDCLVKTSAGYKISFHKTKQQVPYLQFVGDATINAVVKLRENAKHIHYSVYSNLDGLSVKRLIPSKHYKGRFIMSYSRIRDFFDEIQIKSGIIDDAGKSKYSLHDNKRNFVSNMLAAGVSPEEIANFLSQDINSLMPYEVNNELALKTLKKVEEKKLLMGERLKDGHEIINKNNDLINIIRNVNAENRYKENFIYRLNNPRDVLPLSFGYCTDSSQVDICGDLICFACKEYRPANIEEFERYAIKVLTFIMRYKRYPNTKKVEEQLKKSLANIFMNFFDLPENEFKQKYKLFKKLAERQAVNNE